MSSLPTEASFLKGIDRHVMTAGRSSVITHRKVFRFKMSPSQDQDKSLMQLARARRWVWNWGLARRIDCYKATGKTIPYQTLLLELTALKKLPETAWLKEADAQSLQQAIRDLDRAFTEFFGGRTRYPRFKSRKRDTPRFRIPQRVKVADGNVRVPKVGNVRIFDSMDVDLPTKSASFKRDALGHWYVTLVAEFEMPDVPPPQPDPAEVVGIDLGLIDFATLSNGSNPIPAPKFYRRGQTKLKRAQKRLSRSKPGSNRGSKSRLVIAKIHRKTANQRSDFLHKLSTKLVREHGGVCIEDLCLKGLARTKLAKSFTDASMGEFRRQLEYKSLWNRKHLVVVDRWFPSSKTCHSCGEINNSLTLSDRTWTCGCGAILDRDLNAAMNIRDEGLRILAAGHAESLNARGVRVRPAKVGTGC